MSLLSRASGVVLFEPGEVFLKCSVRVNACNDRSWQQAIPPESKVYALDVVVPLLQVIGIALPMDCWCAWRAGFISMLKQQWNPDLHDQDMVSAVSERCFVELRKKSRFTVKLFQARTKQRALERRLAKESAELAVMRNKIKRLMPDQSGSSSSLFIII